MSWLIAAAGGWTPLYLLLMQKRVYGQGWPMTLLKYALKGRRPHEWHRDLRARRPAGAGEAGR